MKTLSLLFTLLIPAAVATAQPPAAPPPAEPTQSVQRYGPSGGREMRRPLDHWLQQMEEKHPEDYEKLMHLKQTDPEAFQRELHSRRDRLRDRNLEAGMAEMPRFREMMENMPPEEREQMAERFSRMMRWHSKRPDPEGAEIATGEQRTRELAQAYQTASETDRESIERELRAQIVEIFELREEQHQCQIEEAEKYLQRLKATLAKRREHKEAIVDRRLQELTRGEPSPRRQRGESD